MGVIGKVGAGKSSLLAAIMGEMRKKTGLVGVEVLASFSHKYFISVGLCD